ncbi:MAG: SDR family oxidoreductase [Chloroflexota bacterium]
MTNFDHLMSGKVCLVTGATAGIGQVTARVLAQQGATVIVVGRNREKSERTVAQIAQQTGNPHVEYLLADLSSLNAVRKLAAEFKRRQQQLHALVNNAGAIFLSRHVSADGLEMTFALNHLSYFLLTALLLDTLKASAPARIVNVSSRVHRTAHLNFDDLQNQHGYSGQNVYAQSKLANILFTYELARRLDGTGITANALHPGVVATDFAKNNGVLGRIIRLALNPFSISVEEGAQTNVYLASAPEVEGVTGKYFVDCKAVPSSPASYDVDAARQLWQVSEQLCGLPSVG